MPAPPIFRLPEEVLVEIFMNVAYDLKDPGSLTMDQDVRSIYRHIYSLLGVCSLWKYIILTRGALWSVIPIIPKLRSYGTHHFRLSLQRARGNMLHLAASTGRVNFPAMQAEIFEVLAEYGASFRTINISTRNLGTIRRAIRELLRHDARGLGELSIQLYGPPSGRLPEDHEYIFPRQFPENELFARLTSRLTDLRIRGAPFYWDSMTFSVRLTTLRISNIVLGHDTAIVPFLQALSSASRLHDLNIISVETYCDTIMYNEAYQPSPISFPNLQQLLLQDLHCNTLQFLVLSIAPCSYCLTIILGWMSLHVSIKNDEFPANGSLENVELAGLCRTLKRIPTVHTLMLTMSTASWLMGFKLRRLLESMPTLKALKIDGWRLDMNVWASLKRPRGAQLNFEEHPFPSLENISFSSATIYTTKGLIGMGESHSVRQMVLGAKVIDVRPGKTSVWQPLSEGSLIVRQLKNNVRNFRLVHYDYTPPEYYSDRWRLW